VLALLSGIAGRLHARNGEDFSFKKRIETYSLTDEKKGEGKRIKLLLNGMGLCEWGFFKVDLYRAALYLEKKCSDPKKIILSKNAKCIQLYFVRELTKDQLQKAYSAAFEANAKESLPRYKKRLDQLKAMMEDVNEGDSLIFTFFPEKGTEVQIKGKVKGLIKGADFGSMFFKLYLGDHPPSTDLKNGLLGLKRS
jgi:hypothetical protein